MRPRIVTAAAAIMLTACQSSGPQAASVSARQYSIVPTTSTTKQQIRQLTGAFMGDPDLLNWQISSTMRVVSRPTELVCVRFYALDEFGNHSGFTYRLFELSDSRVSNSIASDRRCNDPRLKWQMF